MINSETIRLGQILWNFLKGDFSVVKSDFIIVLGSSDTSVALYAAEFWKMSYSNLIVVTGGNGKVTNSWNKTEADIFKSILIENNVPEENILVETGATNTGENFTKTRELLDKLGIEPRTGIILTKPYMQLRAYNTGCKLWQSVSWTVTAKNISFLDYLKLQKKNKIRFINILVGDLQRMRVYGQNGFQIEQEIPKTVWQAYEKLVSLGFDDFVIKSPNVS